MKTLQHCFLGISLQNKNCFSNKIIFLACSMFVQSSSLVKIICNTSSLKTKLKTCCMFYVRS